MRSRVRCGSGSFMLCKDPPCVVVLVLARGAAGKLEKQEGGITGRRFLP